MSVGRAALVGVSALCSVVVLSTSALADKLSQQQKDRMAPQRMSRETPAMQAGDAARARARKGDCAAALDAYDQAVKTSIDPELYRDRGLCHEQLGHPYPAIDDYRIYLRDRPNAADAEQIRQRLSRLEEQVWQGGGTDKAGAASPDNPSTPSSDEDKDKNKAGAGASASASVSVGSGGASASATSSGKSGKSQEDYERDEAIARAASGSPLREASGWILGPYLGYRASGDVTATTAGVSGKVPLGNNAVVGAAMRYSLGKTSTILGEIGYVGFSNHGLGGPGFFLGYEARIALSAYTTDAIILGAGLGFERYRLEEGTNTGGVLNNVLPRARLGYRHVFGDSFGLELHGDGGMGYYWISGVSDVKLDITPVFGGYLAAVFGF